MSSIGAGVYLNGGRGRHSRDHVSGMGHGTVWKLS